MNWDFHCHSTVSDGLLSPTAVVRRAAGNGVALLALTDHDAVDGLSEAGGAAADAGLRLVPGVEVSIEWEEVPVHIVGLAIDPEDERLRVGLDGLRNGRIERARRMSADLERAGIADAFAGAMRLAKNPLLISRAHFARYLVEQGVCDDMKRVFDRFLVPGKPGYVAHRWATMAEAVGWIKGAGGVAVIAHPARYRIPAAAVRRLLGQFVDLGGDGIEVVCGGHTPDDVRHFAGLARAFGLAASRGSDFHGPAESVVDLGCMPPLPEGLTPITERIAGRLTG
jgi:predicted metal-dependent phosphoesterase TrpH